MTFIETGDAGGPNFERVFSARPEVLAAWQQLLGAIKANMDPKRYQLATVAAARRMRSSYACSPTARARRRSTSIPRRVAGRADHHSAGLDPARSRSWTRR